VTKADQAHRAAEETAAFFGQDNLEQLGNVYQVFVQKVDVRALLAWKLSDGLDELLLPLFRAALLAITSELRLAEVTAQLDERDRLRAENERLRAELAGRDRKWAYRSTAVNGLGSHVGIPMAEAVARKHVANLQARPGAAFTYEVVCYDYTDWRTEDEANRAMGTTAANINHDGDQA
jgi:hypothetical protein